MRKLSSFTSLSMDGFFTDANSDTSWAHSREKDAEWDAFVADNAKGGGALVFGRKTYEMMVSFWPTPAAAKQMPEVANGMNAMPKIVFSKSLNEATWNNTTLIQGDPATEMRKLKEQSGPDMAILGSGSIVSQLAQEGLIDQIQVVVVPIILGKGRTLFETVSKKIPLTCTKSRAFRNGHVVLWYEPAK